MPQAAACCCCCYPTWLALAPPFFSASPPRLNPHQQPRTRLIEGGPVLGVAAKGAEARLGVVQEELDVFCLQKGVTGRVRGGTGTEGRGWMARRAAGMRGGGHSGHSSPDRHAPPARPPTHRPWQSRPASQTRLGAQSGAASRAAPGPCCGGVEGGGGGGGGTTGAGMKPGRAATCGLCSSVCARSHTQPTAAQEPHAPRYPPPPAHALEDVDVAIHSCLIHLPPHRLDAVPLQRQAEAVGAQGARPLQVLFIPGMWQGAGAGAGAGRGSVGVGGGRVAVGGGFGGTWFRAAVQCQATTHHRTRCGAGQGVRPSTSPPLPPHARHAPLPKLARRAAAVAVPDVGLPQPAAPALKDAPIGGLLGLVPTALPHADGKADVERLGRGVGHVAAVDAACRRRACACAAAAHGCCLQKARRSGELGGKLRSAQRG